MAAGGIATSLGPSASLLFSDPSWCIDDVLSVVCVCFVLGRLSPRRSFLKGPCGELGRQSVRPLVSGLRHLARRSAGFGAGFVGVAKRWRSTSRFAAFRAGIVKVTGSRLAQTRRHEVGLFSGVLLIYKEGVHLKQRLDDTSHCSELPSQHVYLLWL